MEGKQSPTEIDGGGDNLQNLQNKRKSQSASSSSRCIRQSLENLVSNSSVSLDLSRKDLQHLTEDIYNLFKLKYLHLEGNALSVIPEDFFEQLPNLVWLDLRYNRFKELPSGIGCHKQLKTLLLERNPIKRLPVELEMPPVEKLNLTDVMKSSLDLSDGWPNEEEMIRFQKLRDEFIQDEKEEYLANNLVANESMPALRRTRTKENVSHKPSMVSSRAKKNMFPIISSHDLIIQSKRIEAYKLAALKEMKEKQALIEQRRKDKEVLQQWRRQTKKMREKQGLLYTFSPEKGDMGVSQHAPYATDNVKYHDKLEGWKEPPRQDENTEKTNINAMKTTDDLRAAKYKEVENRIRQHMLMMKERRKRLTGIPQDDMERAKEDFETVEKLEEEIAEMKRDHHKEYRFTAFTGELPPPSENPLPAPKAQNIFFNMTF
ncbi:leucine-rich repeat-containing protein 27 isoform X3 [Sceloporus undulatus]|uniref:leucine-rich repeat-containing protein 27 isoform X3 n=1 Tax=Sceloporus undulatus TaxID=8520 RepID=UPI001C4BA770|nr:leucine-rich repeat-containing protein 27 isoform X3 [Sceloporus undulatus]